MGRIAIISIIIEHNNDESIQKVNNILHEFQVYILGRMGLPDKVHKVNIICIAIFAKEELINALTGKLGKIDGINAKTLFSKNTYTDL